MSSVCAESTGNPVLSLTEQFFRDVGIASSSWNIGQGGNTANSFRSTSNFEEAWKNSSGTTKFDDWNQIIQPQSEFESEWHATEFALSEQAMEDDEEFRQEWSDERLTELYIKKHGLDKTHNDNDNYMRSHTRTRYSQENSFIQEFLESSTCHDRQFSREYSTFTTNNITTYITQHNDLFQAQLYLFDHILSNVLSYPLSITCRPSSESEWDWDRLFSPSRWCEKGDKEEEEIAQDKYLKDVASRRLQLLFGHLGIQTENGVEDGNMNLMGHEIRVAL
ncbi:17214_t:CDS:1 [Acaulospora colombiana]|uniref:17214_t:CDS:1 n=1 Tax=Acaulospora colombiana TaxID=27376 RepID=A0ACA9KMN1_9GLOM|nr:17214_t:CDS:1 [Acaulospora colombiana]